LDLLANLENADEISCPARRLLEVRPLNDWKRLPEDSPALVNRYSTTVFFGEDPEEQNLELWQGGRRIPLADSVAGATLSPSWTLDYAPPVYPALFGNFTSNRTESAEVEPIGATAQVEIAAHGRPATNQWPVMRVAVGSATGVEITVDSTKARYYTVPLWFPDEESTLSLSFINDLMTRDAGDRNLHVMGVRIVPPSTVRLSVAADTVSATEGLSLRFKPLHLGYAMKENPQSLFPLAEDPSTYWWKDLEISAGGEAREALLLPGPSRIAFPLTMPENATLEFAVTVATGFADDVKWGYGTVRWVWKPDDGTPEPLFERFFDPEHRPAERIWREYFLSLEHLAGRTGHLVLETENGFPASGTIGSGYQEEGYQGIRVAHPRVISVPPAESRVSIPFDRPDVIIISIDTLRADHMGCYGYYRNTTPRLDRLAAEATLFEETYSPSSWTLPAHASLFSSRYPSAHGAFGQNTRIGKSSDQLGPFFRRHGYRIGGFVDGGFLSHRFGYARDFDVYRDRRVGIAKILPRARKWWEAQPPGFPRMMFLHCYDVHGPYGSAEEYRNTFESPPFYGRLPWFVDPDSDFRKKVESGELILIEDDVDYMLAMYDGDIRYTDEMFGEFFEYLEEREEWDSSLVILISDHGEEFLEHGSVGHGQSVYQELVHVPLIIKFPRGEWAGKRVTAVSSLVDILPTLADILGEDPSDDWQGISLLPFVTGDLENRNRVFSETDKEFKKITEDYRMIVPTEEADPGMVEQLYDPRFDRGEQFNLFPVAGEWVEKEAMEILAFRDRVRSASGGVEEIRLDAQLAEELRALGYIGN
jgi:arylsulfatase A-like enzyme